MSKSGDGLPVEPGIGLNHWKFAISTGPSDWPKPSQSSRPVRLYHFLKTSGFSGSPAMQQWWMQERSNFVTSSCSMKRNIVGGAQNVVTLYCVIFSSRCSGTNLSMS